MGGECDPYYFPKEVIVANPWANNIAGFNGMHYVNEDCVILKNDSTMCGLYPLINRYTSMLVENDISLLNTDILSRIVALLSVTDDKGKKEADRYIKKIIDGDFSVFTHSSSAIFHQRIADCTLLFANIFLQRIFLCCHVSHRLFKLKD